MSRRIVVSIAAALVLAPLTAFAADGAPTGHIACDCSHYKSMASSATRVSPTSANTSAVNSYQGMTQAELEQIWAASP